MKIMIPEEVINRDLWRVTAKIYQQSLDYLSDDNWVIFTSVGPTHLRVADFNRLKRLEKWHLIKIIEHNEGAGLNITPIQLHEPGFSRYYKWLKQKFYANELDGDIISPQNEDAPYWPDSIKWVDPRSFKFNGSKINLSKKMSAIIQPLIQAKGGPITTSALMKMSETEKENNFHALISRSRQRLKDETKGSMTIEMVGVISKNQNIYRAEAYKVSVQKK